MLKTRDRLDFDTQPETQRFFKWHQPGAPHNLDGNGDAEACEFLPGVAQGLGGAISLN